MKRFLRGACRFPLLAGCVLVLSGWTADWGQVQRDAQAIRSLQASFVQEKHLPILSRPLLSKGTLLYRAPDAIRWEYASPVPSVLILREGEVKRYLPGNGGLVEDRGPELASMGTVLKEVTAWFRGDFRQNPHFAVTFQPAPRPRIFLKPRGEALAGLLGAVEVVLSETPGVISSVRIDEGKGASTLYRFHRVQVNAPLEDRLFRVTP